MGSLLPLMLLGKMTIEVFRTSETTKNSH